MLYNLTEVVPHGRDFCAISTKEVAATWHDFFANVAKEVATTWYDFYKTLSFPSPLCGRCIVRPQLWMESLHFVLFTLTSIQCHFHRDLQCHFHIDPSRVSGRGIAIGQKHDSEQQIWYADALALFGAYFNCQCYV